MSFNTKHTLLLEIDVQNDFCPAYTSGGGEKNPPGALAVEGGDEVIPPLNLLAASLARAGGRVAVTQDWHPRNHVSFASSHDGKKPGDSVDLAAVKNQLLWPDHCVRGSRGAAFHEKLDLSEASFIIRKGFRPTLDSYSAFFENDRQTPTGLDGILHSTGIDCLFIGGLATDYCVFYSVMDAIQLGFKTIVVSDAVRGVNYPAGSIDGAVETMKNSGALFVTSDELIKDIPV